MVSVLQKTKYLTKKIIICSSIKLIYFAKYMTFRILYCCFNHKLKFFCDLLGHANNSKDSTKFIRQYNLKKQNEMRFETYGEMKSAFET